jgi:predicted nucleic acid-binding protein
LTRLAVSFVDTTVLVAALDGGHPHHAPCIGLLAALKAGAAHCALHSYAELYAVMSGKPGKPRLRPADVDAMVERIDQVFTPILLTRREYRQVIRECALRGVAGGRLYDALIAACALKCDADNIYTLNETDFKAVLPATVHSRIRRP